MNASQHIRRTDRRRKAIALVLVITVVALMSILMVAIFSVTRMEYKSTQAFVYSKSAKQLGDIATAIVQAQIEKGQNPDNYNTRVSAKMYTHATQPGMVRTYDSAGNFYAAYKLYSSSNMKVTGDESGLYSDQHVPPSAWNTMPARYVDLNEPVVRPGLATGTYAVYYPILDPRAAWNYGVGGQSAGAVAGSTQVEGFSYTKSAPNVGTGGGQDYSSTIVTPTDASNPDNLRLPMPVEWMYVCEDGTLGVLDASNNFISSSTTTTASASNPIVGRIAFWTDDESCKVNINTAAEPTFLNSPFYFHERDSKWAHFPPVTGEYQRYPGHPATVALSAVLAPNYNFDPLLPKQDGFSNFMDLVRLKEKFYTIAPKISGGGSEGGTRPFAQDDFSTQNGERSSAVAVDLTTTAKARLYATVDEILFQDGYVQNKGRAQQLTDSGTDKLPNGNYLLSHDVIERSRFFLTAQSRSPEFSIHGLPRVCIWPVADENQKKDKWRTTFDNMIAYCATIQRKSSTTDTYKKSYIFRRADSRSGSNDLNITRNSQLLDYLVDQMSLLGWPNTSFSSSSSFSNFESKYGTNNVNQLAIQFFDYIRCTNLYDGITSRNNNAWSAAGSSVTDLYNYRDSNVGDCYTFTMQRISPQPNSTNISGDNASSNQQAVSATGGILPGHGQVSPAVWKKSGRNYKGFGRMITISEIGFQFICTADGQLDTGSLSQSLWTKARTIGLGGGTAIRYGVNPGEGTIPTTAAYQNLTVTASTGSTPAFWYSNFPPLLSQADIDNAVTNYGAETGNRANARFHPSKHPGFYPQFWNMTLPAGVWLDNNAKRVQVMLLLEAFCPSLGYTGIYPEYTIVLDGSTIAQMKLHSVVDGEVSLFNTTGDIPIKSYNNIYSQGRSADIMGGHSGPTAISGGRHTRGISGSGGLVTMPKDVNYDVNNTSGHNALQNYAFCSDFVTVDRTLPMRVTFPSGDIKISIYDTHNWETASPVQVMYVNFSSLGSSVPPPNLAESKQYTESIDSFGRIVYTRALEGPHYWCANYEGCINRLQGVPNPQYKATAAQTNFWLTPPTPTGTISSGDTQGGRDAQALRGRLDTTAAIINDTRTGVSALGITVIAPNGVNQPTDVIRSIVPAMGDYRTLAARSEVPSSWWLPHPLSNDSTLYQVHSFTTSMANVEPGVKLAQARADNSVDPSVYTQSNYDNSYQLIGGARFNVNAQGNTFNGVHPRQADLPPGRDYANAANAFGDFDSGLSNAREGPYINKADEGNFYAGNETLNSQTKFFRSAYFFNTWHSADDWRSGIYMTPNRMIASPVMFGSLPTGVWGNPSGLPTAYSSSNDFAPWQTLLFRPHAQINSLSPVSQTSHPGMQDPSDHYLLDMFFMPVVEPYAISEPLSIAGRVNMNYQIMPFINIRRATGMHAVMKGEFMTAIPNEDIVPSKEYYPLGGGSTAAWDQRYWNDAGDGKYWHRQLDVPATLRQFDLKFLHQSGGQKAYAGLFRATSQICDMHLIPQIKNGGNNITNPTGVLNATSQNQINEIMNSFWSYNRPTGDNVRERPYSNLYARLTTRSNTFRVHVRTQVLKKARSTAANTFVPGSDQVLSEYRGSVLLERYIDPNDPNLVIPDYAEGITQAPLDSFYRFHALETKRFNP